MAVDLSSFDNSWYSHGRSRFILLIWYVINGLFLQNPLNPSFKLKVFLLRLFGAKIGTGVVLKPSINIKYPWNLEIGENTWIGEKVWLDSLGSISIGENVCISQGAYICTGNHDWTDPSFRLTVKPVVIEDGVWIGAHAIVLPDVTVATHSVITAGSIVSNNTEAYMIYSGNPALPVKKRILRNG